VEGASEPGGPFSVQAEQPAACQLEGLGPGRNGPLTRNFASELEFMGQRGSGPGFPVEVALSVGDLEPPSGSDNHDRVAASII
jgi:hypothetical protein